MTLRIRQAGSMWHKAARRVLRLLIAAALSAGPAGIVHGQVSRVVSSDPATGLAIGGYDPMSYFVAGQPKKGTDLYEFEWQGASWRFVSEANRYAFARDPAVYAPGFGGHGALAMAQGTANAGNPAIWVIYKNALYLFFSTEARRKWLLAPETYIDRAQKKWPNVMAGLSR